MNTLLLQPTDVLFFRDGRPIGGSLAGHGAAWPLPNVLNSALRAALWRSGLESQAHSHVHQASRAEHRNRKFGGLRTAGPFPVCTAGITQTWFFPRPADAQIAGNTDPSFLPLNPSERNLSNLPQELLYPVANSCPPSKEKAEQWWSEGAWCHYLGTTAQDTTTGKACMKRDSDFCVTEHSIGIGIDPATDTQDKDRFYSAHYMRLKEHWRLGLVADAWDKIENNSDHKRDLMHELFQNETSILVGGQQRVCTAEFAADLDRLPLPLGKLDGFSEQGGKFLVKWVLLSPAIWPQIEGVSHKYIDGHMGGWLPNWIAPFDNEDGVGQPENPGAVLLLDGPGKATAKRKKLPPGNPINARLVAAIVPKPVVVTGYAGGSPDDTVFQHESGAKSTHLAVPAGAVYYFEADSEPDARNLAAALNWHGKDLKGTELQNRRSALMGEKGFGLGVCGTWQFHPGNVSLASAH